jgi:nucleoid DNA-binding protein
MKKSVLVKKIARQQSVAPATAADRMDGIVTQLIRALKRGEEAHLPGLGKILPGRKWGFRQESDER